MNELLPRPTSGSKEKRNLGDSSTLCSVCRVVRMDPWWRKLGRFVWGLPARVLIGMVRVYQWTLSPLVGRNCRFQPTCSHYFIEAVRKYGAVRGTLKGLWRICRCNPWTPGGYDPP